MSKRPYATPGIHAQIIDYQIKAAPITNPGEIVILLADLPDTVGITDPKDIDNIVALSIPHNIPILLNAGVDLGPITGEEFASVLTNLGGKERHLDIVNVLPMLRSELPLAVMKLVKRNGERPNKNNPLELYEALEVAYEALENFPAGRVVPLPISIEDEVLLEDLKAIDIVSIESFPMKVETTGFGGNVFQSFDILPTNVRDERLLNEMNFVIRPIVDATNTQPVLKVMVDAMHKNVLVDSQMIDLIQAGSLDLEIELLTQVSPEAKNYAALAAIKKAIGEYDTTKTVQTLEDEYHDVVSTLGNFETSLDGLKDFFVKYAVSMNQGTEQVIKCEPRTITINDRFNVPICELQVKVSLNANDPQDANLSKISELNCVLVEDRFAFEGSELFDGQYKVKFMDPALTIDTGIPSSPAKLIAAKKELAKLVASPKLSINVVDRSFNYIDEYDVANETYTRNNEIAIKFPTDKNYLVNSTTLTFTGYTVNKSGIVSILINETEYALDALAYDIQSDGRLKIVSDYYIDYKEVISIELLPGLMFELEEKASVEYVATIVPTGASFDKSLVNFCVNLTENLNDCSAVIGTRPPKTVSSVDIDERVKELSMNLKTKNYATSRVDNGLHLVVTAGAQKISHRGGITNFENVSVSAFDAHNKTIIVEKGLKFVIGDNVDLEIMKKGRYYITENTVTKIVKVSHGVELTLELPLGKAFSNIHNSSIRKCYLSNAKDKNGSYLAAVYAVEANNAGIDKAPFNKILPGESEIFYTKKQLGALLDAKITPVSRNSFNTAGVVIDTPTMAEEMSDFTDQGTVGMIFYFIRQLRSIAGPRKGERFGAGEKQVVFQTELEAPFESQLGETIDAYDLKVDWSKLNLNHELMVSFSIRESKKLKYVTITAKLF